MRKYVDNAWPALTQVGLSAGASRDRLSFTADMPAAVAEADFVQENGPERIAFKQELYGKLDALLAAQLAQGSVGLRGHRVDR